MTEGPYIGKKLDFSVKQAELTIENAGKILEARAEKKAIIVEEPVEVPTENETRRHSNNSRKK